MVDKGDPERYGGYGNCKQDLALPRGRASPGLQGRGLSLQCGTMAAWLSTLKGTRHTAA